MAFNDNAYGLFQGSLFMQRRTLNGAALGGFVAVGDADKFEITQTQKFDDILESQSGLRYTAAHIPIGTEVKVKINALYFSKPILQTALWGTDTGAVAAGSVSAELQTAYNNSVVPLANLGVSAVVAKLAGVTGTIASIAVTAGGTGYLANSLLALTVTGTGAGCTANAVTNAAGVIVGAYVTAAGTGYVSPTATVTTPGAGTGATFQVNMGAATLVSGTDYTADLVNGALTILPGSLLVPAFSNAFAVAPAGTGNVGLTIAYSYGAYAGRVEAFTTGIQYYALRLNGINVVNNQPTLVNCFQAATDMTKMMSMIEAKHNMIELDGMLLQDTTRPLPTPSAPFSQFYNVVKG